MMYKETVHSKERLLSVMDAMEKLGKAYTVIYKRQEGNLTEGIPDAYWEVHEIPVVDWADERETVEVVHLTAKLSMEVPPEFGDEMKQLQRDIKMAGSRLEQAAAKIAEAANNIKVTVS